MASSFETRFNSYAMPGIERLFGVNVFLTYRSQTSAAITARRDEPNTEDYENGVFPVSAKAEHRKYYLPKANCIIDGVEVIPEHGSIIIEGSERWEIFESEETKAVELIAGYDYRCNTRKLVDE